MNRRILVTLKTVERPLPAGTVFSGRVFLLTPADASQSVRRLFTTSDAAEFDDLAPGTYALKVQDMNVEQELGAPVTGEIVIPGDEAPPGGTYMAATGFSYVVA